MNLVMSGAEPFLFPGGPVGCLLIHGFTGTPKEMRSLGEHLAGVGYSVLGIRLTGHATRTEDILRARWRDWLADVEDGFTLLSGTCDRVVVMGLSMGGILALTFAAGRPVSGVVAMSTPYTLPSRLGRILRPIAPVLSLVWPYVRKGKPDWHDPEVGRDHLDYPVNPTRAAAELDDLLAEMRRRLPSVTAPCLLMASRGDATVTPDHLQAIRDHLGSRDLDVVWVEDSGHVITRDRERGRVFAAAASFVRRVAGEPA
jgi:carboxylesterase